jgi:hypothetical protein
VSCKLVRFHHRTGCTLSYPCTSLTLPHLYATPCYYYTTVCLAHAVMRPPVARALNNTAAHVHPGSINSRAVSGDLEGGPSTVGGSAFAPDDPRNMPANANMRLRTRPFVPVGAAVGTTVDSYPAMPIGSHSHKS